MEEENGPPETQRGRGGQGIVGRGLGTGFLEMES